MQIISSPLGVKRLKHRQRLFWRVSSTACMFHMKWSNQTNNSPLGWRVCKPVFYFISLHSVGWGENSKLFPFWKEVRSLKPVSCFSWEEVVVEVKVCFVYTMGAPRGNGRFDFLLGPLLPLVAASRALCFWTAPLPRLFSSAKPNSRSWRR